MNTGSAPPPPPAPFHSASLYVGDLHLDVTEALLFEIFNAVGPVASIRVCRDAVTRRSLGYAYVNFHNVADAERALDTMNYTMIKGRPCRIMWSQRDPSLRKSGVGNIFVKNLDTSIDNKALYDTFSLFGNILSCKVANDTSGNSKGYGYVHYETGEAAAEAIRKINGMLISNKEVFVGHFQGQKDRPGHADWTNCYVKNVPDSWDQNKMEETFAAYGEIVSATLMPKEKAVEGESLHKGFGFVNFKDSDAAKKAVEELNGKSFEDGDEPKELYVGRAMKKAERERELRNKFEALKMEHMNKYQGVNLYVKNLEDTVTDDDLRELFAPCGTITSARIMKDSAGKSRGFGFVCFTATNEATKAVTEFNNKLVKGKPIYVALAQRKEARRAQLEAQHARQHVGGPRGMPMGQGQSPMYGAPPMFYAQPNQMPPRGFVYPQQMMARGPRGAMPGYPMPAYAMPMGGQPQQRQQRQQRQRHPNSPGGRGMPNRNFRYTSTARNAPNPDGQMPNMNQPPQPPQQMPAQGKAPEMEPLTPAALAAASAEQQKNMIGERLYPLIHRVQPELAGKITGMLLEMDNSELLHLLESPDALSSKISEALSVLEAHAAGDAS
jgi:polyadenylate-binding protein